MMATSNKQKEKIAKKYSAPALEKGFDILELLATKSKPISQSMIANELGRSISEVFRMLSCMEARGYIARGENGEGFSLTMQLHNLAHNWPPSKRLLEVALPEMRNLAEQVLQSCHLGLYSAGQLYVAARAESPLPITLSIKVTSSFPLTDTSSGRVLLAFQDKKVADRWIDACSEITTEEELAKLQNILTKIRKNKFERRASNQFDGLLDLSCPILDQQGHAVAACTVPYLAMLGGTVSPDEVIEKLKETSNSIAAHMGYV